jgi:GalNAc-alpha-(1->4)-GalNAc-alpha-(1->3)-diNAcBac-PP-undecaprenol alpha-1,4-N-acetyl-D-galactosaminyltransferase
VTGGVAIVIESLRGGGAQQVASALANSWAQQGIPVTVVTLLPAETDFFRLDPHIRRVVIPVPGASSNLVAAIVSNIVRLRRLRAALKTCSCGTIVSFVGSMNVLTVLAASGLGRRVIIAERNDPARQSLGPAWDWLRRKFYRRADIVVTNSRTAADTLAAYVPSERIIWLPNPLRETGSSQAPVPVAQPFMLAVGRLHRQKAFDVLLSAFAQVSSALPDWKLVILGDGALRESLQQQAVELGVAPRVTFAGHVRDPGPWYRQARMLVHPARFEGLPNVVLEAMDAACPVIVTDAQLGLREFVRDGETGLVVPVESVNALAEAMLRLSNDPELGKKFGRAAREAVAPCRAENAIATWSAVVLGS